MLRALGIWPGHRGAFQSPGQLAGDLVHRTTITKAANKAIDAKWGADVRKVFRGYKRSAKQGSWTPREAIEHAIRSLKAKTAEGLMAEAKERKDEEKGGKKGDGKRKKK